jgi:glucose/arabinose dehydrogenase
VRLKPIVLAVLLGALTGPAGAQSTGAQSTGGELLTGAAAFGDWRDDAPGVRRRILPADQPPPFASRSASNTPSVVDAPPNALPKVPAGFAVQQVASGLSNPRLIRVAPNGDVFVAENQADRIRILRMAEGVVRPAQSVVFAKGLDQPFGIAFYPPGPDPQWVYVANTGSVIRFPYRNGDLKPRGPAETIVAKLPEGGHSTRDVAFSGDGQWMFVSVGSASNVAQGLPKRSADEIRDWEGRHGLGAAWGEEENRADVLSFRPDGGDGRTFATGIRNCVSLVLQPQTGTLWCATNERDGLGDNLPSDYVTSVREGGFYGWPWYFIGAHEDPRHKGERPDLASRITVPDLLLQPHSAPLGMTFYDSPPGAAGAFPASYRGSAFVALHGSWNRSKRTGYKIVRIPFPNGAPDGSYEDFLTGFVLDDDRVWGRPVGVAVAHDGALLVTEDGNSTIWRITYTGSRAATD